MKKYFENLLYITYWLFDRTIEVFDKFFAEPPLINQIYYELFEREDWREIERDILNGVDRTITLKNGEQITLTTNIWK